MEKLIENWTLEERLAGHNRYKSQGSESDSKWDGTKEITLYSKQGNENKLFKTVWHWPGSSPVEVKELHQLEKCLKKTLKPFNFKHLE